MRSQTEIEKQGCIVRLQQGRGIPVIGVAPRRHSVVADPHKLVVLDQMTAIVPVDCDGISV